jgi:hypothetical protein
MKFNKWTLGLAAIGAVSLASAARADEKMTQVQTALSNTTLSGYVDTAAIWRPGTDANALSAITPAPAVANVPKQAFSKNDGFYLNAVDIAIDKPQDESPWAAGYHVEFMFGPDSVPGAGVRQAYLALRTPVGNSGIDWKVGVFDTIIGYESNSSPLNPNYTHSYGYSIEPTTHTGVTGTYKVNDIVSFTAGIADGSNVGPSPAPINGTATYESQKAYLAAIALTAPDAAGWLKGATLNAGIIDGVDSGAGPASTGSHINYYVGATIPTPVSSVKAGASFDYLQFEKSTPGAVVPPPSFGHSEAWAAAVYAAFQINDKTSLNLRGEYAKDDSGLLYGGAGSVAGNRNAVQAATATLQYNLWANVISRAEFRWDHVEHGTPFGADAATGAAFRNNDFMVALNLIYQF